jgi:HSP20 family protein
MSETLTKKEAASTPADAECKRSGLTYSPRFDIWETEDELVLSGDMPGVLPEDLDIRFENRELSIRGKVRPRHEKTEFLYAEYGIGDFYRTFTVGETVDSSKIAAELKNGVVTIHLPKSEKVKPRRIEVTTS